VKKISLFLFILLLCSTFCKAGFEYSKNLAEAHSHIIRLEFAQGHQLIEKEKKLNSQNELVILYENYIDFLKAFVTEEVIHFEQYKKNSSNRVERLKKIISDSPWLHFAIAEIKLQDVFLKIKFREYVSASFLLKSAYNHFEKNQELHPGFSLNYKTAGIIHSVTGSIPPDYRWLIELAGMKGTVKEGNAEIESALTSCKKNNLQAYEEEILFYKSTIQSTLSYSRAAMESTLVQIKPLAAVNPLLQFCYFNLCLKTGNSKNAIPLVDYNQPDYQHPFLVLDYKKGILLLNQLDFMAERYFTSFIQNFKGINFIKASFQKLAWIYLIKGHVAEYKHYISQAVKGYSYTDEDKQAESEMKDGIIPNVSLLKARLLFDGGNYEQARNELLRSPKERFKTHKDHLELTYRLARIYDAEGKNEQAKKLYRQTIQFGETSTSYFAANSSLLLAQHFESINQADSALYYYKKCLSMRNHDYQNSIDQKAKAGVDRTKK
jgi:tetratricopeptide (TPR) repeat protein